MSKYLKASDTYKYNYCILLSKGKILPQGKQLFEASFLTVKGLGVEP